MKITGIAVAILATLQKQITITAVLAPGEELEAGDVDRMLAQLNEADPGSGPTDAPAVAAETASPRRRRGAATASASDGQAENPTAGAADAGAPSTPQSGTRRRRGSGSAEPAAEPEAPVSRRRRGSAEVNPTQTAVAPAEAAQPNAATGRRRARSDIASPATAVSAETPAPTSRRARVTSAQPATPSVTTTSLSEPEEPAKITDADMSKAASEAALVIPVEEIKAYISNFGVATVGDIKQEDRREFLDELRAWITEKAA